MPFCLHHTQILCLSPAGPPKYLGMHFMVELDRGGAAAALESFISSSISFSQNFHWEIGISPLSMASILKIIKLFTTEMSMKW